MCPGELASAGTMWHSSHNIGLDKAEEALRWDWCAPTPRRVVAVPRLVSDGGAGLSSLPWQVLQAVMKDTWTMPSMCLSGLEMLLSASTVSGWHAAQLGDCGCGDGGGLPWHAPHTTWLPSVIVHLGVVLVPPFFVAPWQYAPVQVRAVPSNVGVAPSSEAIPENETSAGKGVSAWPESVAVSGTMWQSLHTTALEMPLVAFRCDWWAPTPRVAVSVLPRTSTGGASLSPLP